MYGETSEDTALRHGRRAAPRARGWVSFALALSWWSIFGIVAASGSIHGVAQAAEVENGRRIFDEAKCQRCHAVTKAEIEMEEGARAKGPDLSRLASERRDAEGLVSYLERAQEWNGKKHPVRWRGTDQELQQLIDWLRRQQVEVPPKGDRR